jgi:chorismate mutase
LPELPEQSEPGIDHVIEQFRDQITENDVAIIDAINKRLTLVTRLHTYKAERGVELIDPSREDWLGQYLQRCNRGPLSDEELQSFVRELLDLTRRETARLREGSTAKV